MTANAIRYARKAGGSPWAPFPSWWERRTEAAAHLREKGDGGELEQCAPAEGMSEEIPGALEGGADGFTGAEWSHGWVGGD